MQPLVKECTLRFSHFLQEGISDLRHEIVEQRYVSQYLMVLARLSTLNVQCNSLQELSSLSSSGGT